eukprot:jgi/Picsp_1/2235/NSC_05699-R1_---NA---
MLFGGRWRSHAFRSGLLSIILFFLLREVALGQEAQGMESQDDGCQSHLSRSRQELAECQQQAKQLSIGQASIDSMTAENSRLKDVLQRKEGQLAELNKKCDEREQQLGRAEKVLQACREDASKSGQSIESKLKGIEGELELIKSMWLPPWLSEKVEVAYRRMEPAVHRGFVFAEMMIKRLSKMTLTILLPLMKSTQGVVREAGVKGGAKAVEMGKKLWEKSPESVQRVLSQSYALGQVVLGKFIPYVRSFRSLLVRHTSRVAQELEMLVAKIGKEYPDKLGWMQQQSQLVSLFIICFPVLLIGMPLLGSSYARMRSAPKSKQGNKQKGKRQNVGKKKNK